jgi:hypothetical protein
MGEKQFLSILNEYPIILQEVLEKTASYFVKVTVFWYVMFCNQVVIQNVSEERTAFIFRVKA